MRLPICEKACWSLLSNFVYLLSSHYCLIWVWHFFPGMEVIRRKHLKQNNSYTLWNSFTFWWSKIRFYKLCIYMLHISDFARVISNTSSLTFLSFSRIPSACLTIIHISFDFIYVCTSFQHTSTLLTPCFFFFLSFSDRQLERCVRLNVQSHSCQALCTLRNNSVMSP